MEAADILDRFAERSSWNEELWGRFDQIIKKVSVDRLLAAADEALIHYSGLFGQVNILGFRVPPTPTEVCDLQIHLHAIAHALRHGLSLEDLESIKKKMARTKGLRKETKTPKAD